MPTKRVLILNADGSQRELDHLPTVNEMQSILGGMIEHVSVLDRVEEGRFIYTSMFVNETGLLDVDEIIAHLRADGATDGEINAYLAKMRLSVNFGL